MAYLRGDPVFFGESEGLFPEYAEVLPAPNRRFWVEGEKAGKNEASDDDLEGIRKKRRSHSNSTDGNRTEILESSGSGVATPYQQQTTAPQALAIATTMAYNMNAPTVASRDPTTFVAPDFQPTSSQSDPKNRRLEDMVGQTFRNESIVMQSQLQAKVQQTQLQTRRPANNQPDVRPGNYSTTGMETMACPATQPHQGHGYRPQQLLAPLTVQHRFRPGLPHSGNSMMDDNGTMRAHPGGFGFGYGRTHGAPLQPPSSYLPEFPPDNPTHGVVQVQPQLRARNRPFAPLGPSRLRVESRPLSCSGSEIIGNQIPQMDKGQMSTNASFDGSVALPEMGGFRSILSEGHDKVGTVAAGEEESKDKYGKCQGLDAEQTPKASLFLESSGGRAGNKMVPADELDKKNAVNNSSAQPQPRQEFYHRHGYSQANPIVGEIYRSAPGDVGFSHSLHPPGHPQLDHPPFHNNPTFYLDQPGSSLPTTIGSASNRNLFQRCFPPINIPPSNNTFSRVPPALGYWIDGLASRLLTWFNVQSDPALALRIQMPPAAARPSCLFGRSRLHDPATSTAHWLETQQGQSLSTTSYLPTFRAPVADKSPAVRRISFYKVDGTANDPRLAPTTYGHQINEKKPVLIGEVSMFNGFNTAEGSWIPDGKAGIFQVEMPPNGGSATGKRSDVLAVSKKINCD
ncbi:hypothetical protein BDY21DRAFT_340777 [Lineolata rhizophorae]|uniref:Uncharacterized protein n=1 Tax=Lineolata rhizophorae TaxID=578093 RepID=A0A6A6P4E0_9PEZI|nr:hypothetical protein BDY21DRAFT_340777 [Lineolata rhizophorae]